MQVRAYAKLNLFLAVGQKRKDGYHSLKTIFERISLSDRIILKSRSDQAIKLRCSDSSLPQGPDNLCYKSASLMQKTFKVEKGADIRIIKRIPVGAGLGGGSSDAAAVLMALNKLWGINASREKLVRLAGKIGADVPFFLYKTPFAQGRGRGDVIRPLGLSKATRLWHILIVPKIRVATPLIYRKWDSYSKSAEPPFKGVAFLSAGRQGAAARPRNDSLTNRSHKLTRDVSFDKMWSSALKRRDFSLINRLLFNSLEPVTSALYPSVSRAGRRLRSLGLGGVLMSGSGPAVFALLSSRKEAVSLSRKLAKGPKSWKIFLSRTE